jgi:hypothetical protein
MKRLTQQAAFGIALIVLVAAAAMSAQAQTNVGVSVGINQPGVYGRIDIGNFPPPPVILPQPVIIAPARVVAAHPAPPLYLYVPPGHQKNWAKHCGRYDACGQPVYFVQERWVRERYEHAHSDDRDRDGGRGHGHDKGKHKGKGKGGRDD